MRIKPSFMYRFSELLRASAIFLGFFIFVIAGSLMISSSTDSGTFNISAYEVSASITVFVFGIVTVREDLRLGIQNGVSRKSVFFAILLSSLLATCILAIVGDLITMLFVALSKNLGNVAAVSLYQLIIADETPWFRAPFSMHLSNVLLTFAMTMGASLAGSFISLVFYRLNKTWTIIVAVGTPLLLFYILPYGLSRCDIDFAALFSKISFTPANLTAFFAAAAALTAAFNFLLIRRAPIKAPVK
ncbi:MAG: hypothetical protein EOM54_06680 [Clostridia bacterium]|nr:hypothetical protein [Clostridia bacterium]